MNNRIKKVIYEFFDVNFGPGLIIERGPALYNPNTFEVSWRFNIKTNKGTVIMQYQNGIILVPSNICEFVYDFFKLEIDLICENIIEWSCSANKLNEGELENFITSYGT